MNLLKEEINGIIYFHDRKKENYVEKKCKIKLYSGSIEVAFQNLQVSHVTFFYNKQEHTYALQNMGGRYFMTNYEDSAFYRLFKLEKEVPSKPAEGRKLKI